MMELSEEIHEVLATIRLLVKESGGLLTKQKVILDAGDLNSSELIDMNEVNFDNDETWLIAPRSCESTAENLKEWLYHDTNTLKDYDFHTQKLSIIRELTKLDNESGIDSRTYTRPKKRFNRPSIENYNNNYFKMSTEDNKYKEEETLKEQTRLKFDYTQPLTTCSFNSIVASAPDVDSFQNMSPPSLVNSMCSSTFTNLMESSYIQNDPILREIRDADLTEDMLQDYEPPLFKSLNDSCTSINSDTPEGFLKRSLDTTFKKIYKKNVLVDKENILNGTFSNESDNQDVTYLKDTSSEFGLGDDCLKDGNNSHTLISTPPSVKSTLDNTVVYTSSNNLNGTYRKSAKLNKSSSPNNSSDKINDDLNRTVTIVDSTNRFSNIKRHSYIIDSRSCDSDITPNKRNSFGYSAGSCDSLDYVSSLSNSSKGSNKMLNMAEVDALVLQQEQSLQQVMSTPKPNKVSNKLWDNNVISPISSLDQINGASDSESSNDDYVTIGSSSSNINTPYESETQLINSTHSLDKMERNPKSVVTIPTKITSNNGIENNLRGSRSNLKTAGAGLKGSYTNLKTGIKGSYSNIAQPSNFPKGSYSNLYTMKSNLKASYTQLKPVLTNLPQMDVTTTISKPTFKQPSADVPKKSVPVQNNVAKSQLKSATTSKLHSKVSSLPRPLSSIPRPSSSRIPAPKSQTTNYRPMSRPVSKVDFDDDF